MTLSQIWGLNTILKPELQPEMSLFFGLQCSGIVFIILLSFSGVFLTVPVLNVLLYSFLAFNSERKLFQQVYCTVVVRK